MGKRFSFIHCADLHLGEPFAGLRSGDVGPWTEAIGKATFRAFEQVIDMAIEAHTDAVLISGDVYNDSHHSLAAQMAFAREMYRAAQSGIRVFIVHGNHDPDDAWRADIPLPDTVHIFSSERTEAVPLFVDGERVATVYGRSFATQHVRENLAETFVREPDDGFAIGMLHTEIGNADSLYAPCSTDDLRRAHMDYWALGHQHTRAVLSENPFIVYPGNTQGLDARETGPRGCYLVDVGTFGTVSLTFRATDMIRWVDLAFDISKFEHAEALLAEIRKVRATLKSETNRPNIVRLIFTGRGPLHRVIASESGREYLFQALNEREQFRHVFTYYASIEDRTQSELDLEGRRNLPDGCGDFLRAYDEAAGLSDEELWNTLSELAKIQPEMVKLPSLFGMVDKEMMLEAFKRAELLGAEKLIEEGNDENH